MSSNDLTDGSATQKQTMVTAAVHIKPEKQTRISLSAYRDVIFGNSVGAHLPDTAAHSIIPWATSAFGTPVDLDFRTALLLQRLPQEGQMGSAPRRHSFNRTGLADGNEVDPPLVGWTRYAGALQQHHAVLLRRTTRWASLGRLYAASSGRPVHRLRRSGTCTSNPTSSPNSAWAGSTNSDPYDQVRQIHVERLHRSGTGSKFQRTTNGSWKFRVAYNDCCSDAVQLDSPSVHDWAC